MQKFHKCIQLCVSCALECSKCAAACLGEKDFEMLLYCIKLDRDCTAMCQTAVSAMANENPLAGEVCKVCADMCDVCADECEKHSHHDHCKRCAEVCRECAAECRRVIAPVTIT